MKKLNKIIIYLHTLLIFLIGLNFSDQTIHVQENIKIMNDVKNKNKNITEYKNTYVWKYKIINGKLYKRKYNEVTGEWVGKWIPV